MEIRFNPRFPQPSAETIKKLLLSKEAALKEKTRLVKCPVCGFTLTEISVEQKTSIYAKCQKCKFSEPLSPAFFRRMKRYSEGLQSRREL